MDISLNAIDIIDRYIKMGNIFIVTFYINSCNSCEILYFLLKDLSKERCIPLLRLNGNSADMYISNNINKVMDEYKIEVFPSTLIFKNSMEPPLKIVGINMDEITAQLIK